MAIKTTAPNLFQGKENYIIGIGIDEYSDRRFPIIKSCKRDIKGFVNITTKNFKCFDEKNFKALYNEKATKDAILEEIKRIAYIEKASEWNLIIYFAGHGHYTKQNKTGYWIPFDATYDKVRTYLSFKEVTKIIERSELWHILIICDSCYGGSIFKQYRDIHFTPNCYKIKSRWGLTSGRIELVLDGTITNPSPFSQVLVDVLTFYSKINSEIRIRELVSEIEKRFENEYPNEKQMPEALPLEIPNYVHNNGQFVFIPRENVKVKIEISNGETSIKSPHYKLIEKPNIQIEEKYNIKENPKIVNTKETIIYVDTIETVLPKNRQPKQANPYINYLIYTLTGVTILFALYIKLRDKITFPSSANTNTEASVENQPIGIKDIYESKQSLKSDSVENRNNDGVATSVGDSKAKILQEAIQANTSNPIKYVKLPESTQIERLKNANIVFVGSFENKENAEYLLSQLKEMGYKNAEIVMKENSPYAVVVSDFYYFKSSAKDAVKSLKNRGIDAYFANKDLTEIYRKIN